MKYFIIILALFWTACSALEGEQKTNVNDIIKSQEIKRVTRADIMVHAEVMGAKIMATIKKSVAQDTCLSGSYSATVVDSLKTNLLISTQLGVSVDQFSNDTEKQLFEAYQYNFENQLPLAASVQSLDEQHILYTFADVVDLTTQNCGLDTVQLVMWSFDIPVKTIVNDL